MSCLNCGKRELGCHANCPDYDELKRRSEHTAFEGVFHMEAPYYAYKQQKTAQRARDDKKRSR